MLASTHEASTTLRKKGEDTSKKQIPINAYSQESIAAIAPHLFDWHPRLLVFNGISFEVYNLDHKDSFYWENPSCERCGAIVPLLVRALKELKPERFKRGQPMFQLLFSDADYVSSSCVNVGECPTVKDFAPLLLFGSSPVNESLMPSVKGFPNMYYVDCLYQYKLHGIDTCEWREEALVDRDLSWDSLKNTIIWRGSDFPFIPRFNEHRVGGIESLDFSNAITNGEVVSHLYKNWDTLTPRWVGEAITLNAELNNLTWVDIKFSYTPDVHKFEERGLKVQGHSMSPQDMSQYKYLIDIGGIGGTSWRGTVSKLGMP